jgi:hypothetical protein
MPCSKQLRLKTFDDILIEYSLNNGRFKTLVGLSNREIFPLQACFGSEVIIDTGVSF